MLANTIARNPCVYDAMIPWIHGESFRALPVALMRSGTSLTIANTDPNTIGSNWQYRQSNILINSFGSSSPRPEYVRTISDNVWRRQVNDHLGNAWMILSAGTSCKVVRGYFMPARARGNGAPGGYIRCPDYSRSIFFIPRLTDGTRVSIQCLRSRIDSERTRWQDNQTN